MSDIVHELRGLAIGMAAPSLARDAVTRAANEIERLERINAELCRDKNALVIAGAGLFYPNGKPKFTPDGMMLDENGNRSIFDDVDA